MVTASRPLNPWWGVLVGSALAGVLLPLTLVSPAGASSGSKSHTVTVSTERVSRIGTVLATSSGRTLYRFTKDSSGKATCTGSCAQVWPPLLVPKGDHVKGPHGVKGLGTIHVGHGHLQVAFHGRPLYRFSGDAKKGQAKGQGIESTWYAVLENGKSSAPAVVPLPPATTTTTSTPATSTATTQPVTSTTRAPTTTTPLPPPTTTTPPPPTTTPPPPTTTTPPTPTTTTTVPPGGGYGY
jgi:predicted lipoprotein with Yx(FWY)xxD motif